MTKSNVPREQVDGFDSLAQLALDLRWSWNHATDEVWRQLDSEPVGDDAEPVGRPADGLARPNPARLGRSPSFASAWTTCSRRGGARRSRPAWFQKAHPQSALTCAAYFSMEFMLSEALPIYSGGLGNVAGDQLKATSDLGVPVVGVGLLWQQGYFRQVIGQDGSQQALFPYNDPGQLPITPLRLSNGEWLRFQVDLPGYSVWLRAWQVQVGRVKLYLLDSNDAANLPAHRAITSELYGGGPELRLQQEIVLGIGGWRLLAAMGLKPEVCHLNEGHAALAVLERALGFMREAGQPFDVAMAVTRPGNVFTTHTAVAAGFDRFAPDLVHRYLGAYAEQKLGITTDDLLALGRRDPNDSSEAFNMAYLAVRGSGSVNGVSRLHGEVSRHIFAPLFPRWPQDEVPIGHVTNGVHMPTWDSAAADDLWTKACGKDRWLGTTETLAEGIRSVPDERPVAAPHRRPRVARDLRSRSIVPPTDRLRRVARSHRDGEAPLRPESVDPRLCATLCDLQETGLAPARSRPASASPRGPRAPGPTDHRRQGPPGGRGRAGADSRMDHVHPTARGASPRHFLERLRHAPDGAPGPGRRRLDQHAAATVGGVRNERHEGARERRYQPFGIGRLVGRGLRPRGRDGL